MLSNDHETERTKDPLDSSSIEAEIGSQSQKQMFSSEIAEPSDHDRVCITRCRCNMNQLKNELQRELLGEMTLEASDRVGNQFSVQRTPVGSHCTLHSLCTVHTAQCTMHYQNCYSDDDEGDELLVRGALPVNLGQPR